MSTILTRHNTLFDISILLPLSHQPTHQHPQSCEYKKNDDDADDDDAHQHHTAYYEFEF